MAKGDTKTTKKGRTTTRAKMPRSSGAKSHASRSKSMNRGNGRTAGRGNGKSEITATNLSAVDRRYIEKYGKELSPSVKRAKWINSPDEHQDRNGQGLATRSHDVIEHWAEERGAVPATVPGTEHGNHLGVMRFNFPGYGGRSLQEVSWDDWFNTFDARKLTFLFQEYKKDGTPSNFFKLNSPMREDG